ncbi:MAG: T9SS type A sorting domain-containing protein [Bacteroidales bacterium]|nr:T9SS type A sorting domain-containing protein [Bacteroidales bacterium]
MKTSFLSLAMIFLSIELNAQHWSQQNTKMAGTYTAVNQVSVVDSNIVWVNGWNGSNQGGFIKAMARTKDQGITWTPGSYAGFGTYVRPSVLCGVSYYKAFCVAYDTAAGVGSFWKTTNGGTSWTTVPGVLNNGTTSFANGVKFWDHGKGFCYGDPVNNYFEIYTTSDSGSTWNAVNISNIPVSLSGEYGYNGSMCASIVPGGIGFFITNKGRVFKTIDYGASWALTPNAPYGAVLNGKIVASSASYILFGNYPTSASTVESWKYTDDGGTTWDTLVPTGNFYRYQLCYVPNTPNTFVSTSPYTTKGVSHSYDGGKTWTDFTDTSFLQPGGSNIQCLGVGFYNSEIGWVGNYTQPFTFNSILKYSSLTATASASQSTICSGGSSQLNVVATGGNLYSYSWTSSPAGFTSNIKNPIVSPTATTTYTVTVKSGPNTTTSSVVVTFTTAYLPASISISSNPKGAICPGMSVTFTASPTNEGLSPTYQWKVNNSNAGTNSSTFTSSNLQNGDILTCILTSSHSCATGNPATSNSIPMTVSSSLPFVVNITASPSGEICSGNIVTFSENHINGGASPSYQWKINNSNVGTNSPTFTSSTLNNGDKIKCVTTSSLSCAAGNPATSNVITVSVSAVCPWQQTSLNNTTVTEIAISGNNILAVDGSVYLSSDMGNNWTKVNNGLPANIYVDAIAASGSTIFIGTFSLVASSGVYISSNNGSNWALASGLPAFTMVDEALAVSGNYVFVGTTAGSVYLSSNNGSSWGVRNNGLPGTWVYKLAISGSNIFAGTNGEGIYLSTNNGSNWAVVNTGIPANSKIRDIVISGNNIFASTFENGVFLSSNNGGNWTAVNNGLPANAYVNAIAVNDNNVFAGTVGDGVYISTNNGGAWTAVNTGLTNDTVLALAIYEDYIYAGTATGGVWKRSISGITTGIHEIETTVNNIVIYPNPASNNITIESNERATIEIFNMQGQLIQGISTNSPNTNVDISAFPDGVYVLKAKSGKGIVTKKFVKQ